MLSDGRVVAIYVVQSKEFFSGYALDGGQILTAAHGLSSVEPDVRVWYLGDLSKADSNGVPIGAGRRARVSWLSANPDEHDVALLQLLSGNEEALDSSPVWSSLKPDAGGLIECEAKGFPKFQRRGALIDTEHFRGYVERGSGQRRGELNALFRHGQRQNEDWAGMSGAALFAAGCLIGIVRQVDTDRLRASPLLPAPAELLSKLIHRPPAEDAQRSIQALSSALTDVMQKARLVTPPSDIAAQWQRWRTAATSTVSAFADPRPLTHLSAPSFIEGDASRVLWEAGQALNWLRNLA